MRRRQADEKFKENGPVNDKPRSRRSRISKETVTVVREAFERGPQKSVRRALEELNVSRPNVHTIIKVILHEHVYKIQVAISFG
jgi:hypothetical protein